MLNKTVKPIFNGSNNTYPLYVQVIADRVNYKMKSNFEYWNGYVGESDFNTPFIQRYLDREKEEIIRVVSFLIENGENDLLNAANI